jgi:hypothetical protein
MENQSKYDPSRKTVGAIYRDAQLHNTEKSVQNGDLTNELMSSLVCDLNDTIASDPYEGRPFFITVHEKKDLAMPKMLLRRIVTSLYRPYPEDDTVVFSVDPKSNDVRFCWCLPHWSEMDNMLANETLFDRTMIEEIRSWKNLDLYAFGFRKDPMGNWEANPFREDSLMRQERIQILRA